MNFYRKTQAIALFLRVGIRPRKASEVDWHHANAVLRKHQDLNAAERAFRERGAAHG